MGEQPCENERHENQCVFRPLVQAHAAHQPTDARRSREDLGDGRDTRGGAQHRTWRFDNDCVLGAAPDRNVSARVAGIVESVRKSFSENLRLGFAFQVVHAVAADDATNKCNPPNGPFRNLGVGGRGDVDRPSAHGDIRRVGKQLFVERQNIRLDVGFLGETALEISAATQHPEADIEYPPWRGSKQRQYGLEQHISAHERAIEIEDQGPGPRRSAKIGEVANNRLGQGDHARLFKEYGCRNPSRYAACAA